MDRHSWVVSNPPHRDMDHDKAAALLGVTKAESRIKVNFSAPEIWLAYPEDEGASEAATALKDVGLNVQAVGGQRLSSLPWPEPASSFSFESDGFVANMKEGPVELPYSVPIIGVFCKPPADVGTGSLKSVSAPGSARHAVGQRSTSAFERLVGGGRARDALNMVEALERATSLDLYVSLEATLRRITIAQDVVEFSGLGKDMHLRSSDNMAACVSECERRFTHLVLDKRLVNVRPRRRLVMSGSPQGHENRKLFSFGTLGLRELLESASPQLRDITQFELGSRLAYVLLRQSGAESVV